MHQHRIAVLMAVRVVHHLEVVQVEHHDRRPVAIAVQFFLARQHDGAAVQGLGERVVRGQVLQLGAQPVGGQQDGADGQHQHRQHIGADIHRLVKRGLHDVVARPAHQHRDEPRAQHQDVRGQNHLDQAHGKALATVTPEKAQVRAVQRGHHQREDGDAQRIAGRNVGQPHEYHCGRCHHAAPHDPPPTMPQESTAPDIVNRCAQHQRLVGKHHGQQIGQLVPCAEEHGGGQPQHRCGRPIVQTADIGRVVAPHEQKHHRHHGGHEATHGYEGTRIELHFPALGEGAGYVRKCFVQYSQPAHFGRTNLCSGRPQAVRMLCLAWSTQCNRHKKSRPLVGGLGFVSAVPLRWGWSHAPCG